MDELGNTKSHIKELRNFHTHTLRANAKNTTEEHQNRLYPTDLFSHSSLTFKAR